LFLKNIVKNNYDVAIIGGGPAGMAAALKAKETGCENIIVIDREFYLGGILQQCIHPGFGLKKFGKELTGPEYAHSYIKKIKSYEINYLTDTSVINIDSSKKISLMGIEKGLFEINAKSIILAMGCRERTRGNILTPGYRPAGIFTAGTAQRLINIDGLMVGKKVVIVGSGDIGLIMARRLVLEGAEVICVLEILSELSGLTRNYHQCLIDFEIPLFLSHAVTFIHGKERVSGVSFSKIDGNQNIVKGTERYVDCDTVLFSVGLIPENELSKKINIEIDSKTNGPVVDNIMQTTVEGIFACGNVVQVYDLVDYVSDCGEIAGQGAALFVNNSLGYPDKKVKLVAEKGIKSIVPQVFRKYRGTENNQIYLRVSDYKRNIKFIFHADNEVIAEVKKQYAIPSEMITIDVSKFVEKFFSHNEIHISVKE
jgi:thioredoxin reductase